MINVVKRLLSSSHRTAHCRCYDTPRLPKYIFMGSCLQNRIMLESSAGGDVGIFPLLLGAGWVRLGWLVCSLPLLPEVYHSSHAIMRTAYPTAPHFLLGVRSDKSRSWGELYLQIHVHAYEYATLKAVYVAVFTSFGKLPLCRGCV